MTTAHPPDDPVPDALAAELAPDLVTLIGHLVTGTDDAGQRAALTGAQAAVLDRAHETLAGFHEDALAWAAGAGPGPCWQSWANRLALTLGELLGELDPPLGPGINR